MLRVFSERRRLVTVIVVAGSVGVLAEITFLIVLAGVASSFAGGHVRSVSFDGIGLHFQSSPALLLGLGGGLVVVRAAAESMSNHLIARTSAHYEAATRQALFDAYLHADWQSQQSYRTGDMQSVVIGDVDGARQVITGSLRALSAILGFSLMLLAAFVLSPPMAATLILTAGLLSLGLRPLAMRSRRAAGRYLKARGAWADEFVQGQSVNREIAVYGVVDWALRRSAELIAIQERERQSTEYLSSEVVILYQTVTYLVAVVTLLVVVVTGAAVATLTAVALLLVRALSYSQRFQGSLHGVSEFLAYADHLGQALENLRAARSQFGTRTGLSWKTLRLEGASFSYLAGKRAIDDVSFSAEVGEVIGLIGPSGSGKSTVASLALGLLQPEAGRVLVDEVELRSIDAAERGARCAFVPQEAALLANSVRENIAFGRPSISPEDVREAARRSGIWEEILNLPSGFEEIAEERGGRFSVGQRQRIAIARALAGRPSIVVFDEPTSALDPISEKIIHDVLLELRQSSIVIVISHRRESAMLCDRVLLMREGRLVGTGSGSEMWGLAGFDDSSGGPAT
jgi:ABC-type multidrug transport system fused ATPase/permease subunit